MKKLQEILAHGFNGERTREKMTDEEYEQWKADVYNSGVGDLNEKDGYDCPECKNKGFIAEVKDCGMYFTQTLVPCKCKKIRSAIWRLNRSGLKDIVKKYTFKNFETPEHWQEQIKKAVIKFAGDSSNNHWLLIAGQSGCGKTHLCTACAVSYIKAGYDVKYMLWLDEVTKIKSAKVNDTHEYIRLMKELKEAEVLYIDDLFKLGKDESGQAKMPTAADISIAFEVLNYRYNNPDAITIISTERSLNELCDIDEATAGRIAEYTKKGGYCINIKRDSSRNWRLKDITDI